MRSINIILMLILILFYSQFSFASFNETLPSWHWAYEYIHDLQLQGRFDDLFMLNQPFTRGEVAEALLRFRNRMVSAEFNLSNSEIGRFKRLVREFAPEIKQIKGDTVDLNFADFGIRIETNMDYAADHEVKYRGIYRTKIDVPIGKHITVYNGINFDQYLVDDPDYVGKKWRGVVGYTEQAYISGNFGPFKIKFGRDFLKLGAGENGDLLFSNVCRPLDQFIARARLGHFQYSFITSELDEMILTPELADSLGGYRVSRYLTAHRLDAKFFKGRLQCAITEVILYGGVSRQMDWVYINPFIFYHGEQLNKSGLGNTFGTVDLLFYPIDRLEFYGSFLIDDVQIEKTGSGDLEPNEIGYIVGGHWGDGFQLNGLTVSTEYARVTNRTYKTPNFWETFMHRNIPLGHPLGNDFDLWEVDLSQWIGANFWIQAGYTFTRKGEGSLFTPWDEPWMDYTIEEGYSEPFPTGVVEKRKQIGVEFKFYPSIHWGIQAEAHWQWRENADHIQGVKREENWWRIGVWFDGDFPIKIGE